MYTKVARSAGRADFHTDGRDVVNDKELYYSSDGELTSKLAV